MGCCVVALLLCLSSELNVRSNVSMLLRFVWSLFERLSESHFNMARPCFAPITMTQKARKSEFKVQSAKYSMF